MTLQFPALEAVAGEVQDEEAEQREVDRRPQNHLAHLAQPEHKATIVFGRFRTTFFIF